MHGVTYGCNIYISYAYYELTKSTPCLTGRYILFRIFMHIAIAVDSISFLHIFIITFFLFIFYSNSVRHMYTSIRHIYLSLVVTDDCVCIYVYIVHLTSFSVMYHSFIHDCRNRICTIYVNTEHMDTIYAIR